MKSGTGRGRGGVPTGSITGRLSCGGYCTVQKEKLSLLPSQASLSLLCSHSPILLLCLPFGFGLLFPRQQLVGRGTKPPLQSIQSLLTTSFEPIPHGPDGVGWGWALDCHSIFLKSSFFARRGDTKADPRRERSSFPSSTTLSNGYAVLPAPLVITSCWDLDLFGFWGASSPAEGIFPAPGRNSMLVCPGPPLPYDRLPHLVLFCYSPPFLFLFWLIRCRTSPSPIRGRDRSNS